MQLPERQFSIQVTDSHFNKFLREEAIVSKQACNLGGSLEFHSSTQAGKGMTHFLHFSSKKKKVTVDQKGENK